MSESNGKMIVLGGGLAGLAASHWSGAPVYEAKDCVGGVAGSEMIDGFSFDYGIHVLQTQHETIHDLLSDVGVPLVTNQRSAHIYSHDRYTAYPFQVNTAGLPVGLRAKCLWRYLRRDANSEPSNYHEWISQNVGTGFGETFLVPYSHKFWTVHPREMTHEWTGNRVPQPSTWQVLRGALISRQTKVGTNAVFQYPGRGDGYGAIPNAMAEHSGEIHLNHRATRIDTTRRVVEFNGTKEVSYGPLISTLPLPILVDLIPEAPAKVHEAVKKLRTNSIYVVNLGIDRPNVSDRHWVHFPEPEFSFFRISYPHNLGPGMAPEGKSSVAAEVAYSPEAPLDKDTIVDRVIEDLIKVRAIRADDPIIVKSTMDIPFGYVIFDKHRKPAIRVIHDWLQDHNIYPTGRYGLWAYLWSHEAILSGKQTAERLLKQTKNLESAQCG